MTLYGQIVQSYNVILIDLINVKNNVPAVASQYLWYTVSVHYIISFSV